MHKLKAVVAFFFLSAGFIPETTAFFNEIFVEFFRRESFKTCTLFVAD
jgi:hypothetical protein